MFQGQDEFWKCDQCLLKDHRKPFEAVHSNLVCEILTMWHGEARHSCALVDRIEIAQAAGNKPPRVEETFSKDILNSSSSYFPSHDPLTSALQNTSCDWSPKITGVQGTYELRGILNL